MVAGRLSKNGRGGIGIKRTRKGCKNGVQLEIINFKKKLGANYEDIIPKIRF